MAGVQMRYRLGIILATALLLTFANPAHAERVVQEGAPGVRKAATLPEFLVGLLIKELGPFELAFVTVNPSTPIGPTFIFEYLPPGEELNNWKRMVSVQVSYPGRTPAEAMAALNWYLPAVQQNYGRLVGGSVSFSEITQEADGPALYLEAVVGEGNEAEDSFGVWRRLNMMVVNVMNQKRGGKLTEEDRQATKRVRSQGITVVTGPRPE